MVQVIEGTRDEVRGMGDAVQIPVVRVQWADERPCCKVLIECWKAGRDMAKRCAGYGQYRPGREDGEVIVGYCPVANRGKESLCAMDDPAWVFEPGWEAWAADPGRAKWPGFKDEDLVAYRVVGDCMAPAWRDGDVCYAVMGDGVFESGDPCVVRFFDPWFGFPLEGLQLKRVWPVLGGWSVLADNGSEPPRFYEWQQLKILAVAFENVDDEVVWRSLEPVHVFDELGEIVQIPAEIGVVG